MVYALIAVGLVTSFWSAFQAQIISFVPQMGLATVHKFENKRWILRITAILCVCLLIYFRTPSVFIPVGLILSFLVLSFFIDNTKVFRALSADEIDKSKDSTVDGQALVVGVSVQGVEICYPLENVVIPRHILNDTVEGISLLISYCAACRSCMVYDPMVSGKRLTFEVIGVWRRNMVMRDRETGTLWQQATGEALYGKLKGSSLKALASQQIQLNSWLKLYPNSLVARESDRAPKSRVPRNMLMRALKITEKKMVAGFTDLGNELPLREKVFGLTIGGLSKAYPQSALRNHPEGKIADQLGEIPVLITYDKETNQISGVNQTNNSELVLESHWWLGWKEFHPFTQIWKPTKLG